MSLIEIIHLLENLANQTYSVLRDVYVNEEDQWFSSKALRKNLAAVYNFYEQCYKIIIWILSKLFMKWRQLFIPSSQWFK